MKNLICVFLLQLMILGCNALQAQWVQTSGPGGGAAVNSGLTDSYGNCPYIVAFAFSGTNLFAGTNCGVFLSTDYGASWAAVDSGLTDFDGNCQFIEALAFSGTNLFAGTHGSGVFLSTNNGTSWSSASEGLPKYKGDSSQFDIVSCLAVSGTNIFACTYGSGVFLSTNNGTSWSAANSGLTDPYGNYPNIEAFAFSGTNLFAGTDRGVFLSTDNGTSWSAVNGGVFTRGEPYSRVNSLVISGTNLFAGTFDGVFLSTNNGTNWTVADSGLANSYVQCLAVSGMNLFAGTASRGVFLSTDSGTSWTAVNNGYANTRISSLYLSGTNLFAATCFTSRSNFGTSWCSTGLYCSTDDGMSWTATGLQTTAAVVALAECPDETGGTDLFAGTDDGFGYGGAFRSTDNGTSWTEVASGLADPHGSCPSVDALAVSPNGTGGMNLFAGNAHRGVFLSTDNGTDWSAVNSGLADPYGGGYPSVSVSALAVSPNGIGGTNLVAGTDGALFLSTNYGTSWTAVDSGLTDSHGDFPFIGAVVFSGANLFAATYGSGVFLSTNNGTSWSLASEGLPKNTGDSSQFDIVSCLAVSGTNIFAGTLGSGIFLSTNNGTTWTAVDSGLTRMHVNSLAVSGTNLFAGTNGSGVWRRPLSQMITSSENHLSEVPKHFRLEQNYPNPFNPTTEIRYQISEVSNVSLKVYDVLGREVRTLVNRKQGPGTYEVRFDASGLASGVYFCGLRTKNYKAIRKMVVVK